MQGRSAAAPGAAAGAGRRGDVGA